jgi:hypothetical protein
MQQLTSLVLVIIALSVAVGMLGPLGLLLA